MMSGLGANPGQQMQNQADPMNSFAMGPGLNGGPVVGAPGMGHRETLMGGIDMSAIAPDESQMLMNQQEQNEMFGTGNIGPDKIRLSIANMKRNGLAQGVPPPD